jgi:hypothetical protein
MMRPGRAHYFDGLSLSIASLTPHVPQCRYEGGDEGGNGNFSSEKRNVYLMFKYALPLSHSLLTSIKLVLTRRNSEDSLGNKVATLVHV